MATSYSNKSGWGKFWHREGSWRYAYGLRPYRSWWLVPIPVGVRLLPGVRYLVRRVKRWS